MTFGKGSNAAVLADCQVGLLAHDRWKWGRGFAPEGMSSQTGTHEGKWFVLGRKWVHTSGWGWPNFFLSLVPRNVVPRLQITERSGWFCMGKWAVSWLFWVWFRVIGIIPFIIFHSPVSVAKRRDTAFLEQPASKLKILQRLKAAGPFQQPSVDCERWKIRRSNWRKNAHFADSAFKRLLTE